MTDERKQTVLVRVKDAVARYTADAADRAKAEAYILLNGTRIWPNVDAYLATAKQAAEDHAYIAKLIEADLARGPEERS